MLGGGASGGGAKGGAIKNFSSLLENTLFGPFLGFWAPHFAVFGRCAELGKVKIYRVFIVNLIVEWKRC